MLPASVGFARWDCDGVKEPRRTDLSQEQYHLETPFRLYFDAEKKRQDH